MQVRSCRVFHPSAFDRTGFCLLHHRRQGTLGIELFDTVNPVQHTSQPVPRAHPVGPSSRKPRSKDPRVSSTGPGPINSRPWNQQQKEETREAASSYSGLAQRFSRAFWEPFLLFILLLLSRLVLIYLAFSSNLLYPYSRRQPSHLGWQAIPRAFPSRSLVLDGLTTDRWRAIAHWDSLP